MGIRRNVTFADSTFCVQVTYRQPIFRGAPAAKPGNQSGRRFVAGTDYIQFTCAVTLELPARGAHWLCVSASKLWLKSASLRLDGLELWI